MVRDPERGVPTRAPAVPGELRTVQTRSAVLTAAFAAVTVATAIRSGRLTARRRDGKTA